MSGAATAGPVPKKDTIPYKTYSSDFFAKVPVQQDYNNVFWRTFEPQTSITSTDVIVFELPRMANTQVYCLNRLHVLMSFKLQDEDGNSPDGKSLVAPTNDIINS